MECLFCNNETEEGQEACKECLENFENEAVLSDYPICGKCGTYKAECRCD